MKLDLYEFETVADAADMAGAGGEAGAEAATPVLADPAAVAGEGTPSPEAPAAPAWSPDDPAFVDAVDQRAAEVANAQMWQTLQQLGVTPDMLNQHTGQPQPQGQQEFAPLDPFDPEAFTAGLDQRLAALAQGILGQVQQTIRPVTETFEQQRAAEHDEVLQDVIADEVARNGDMSDDAKNLVPTLARAMYPQLEQQFQYLGPLAANKAADAAMAQTFKTLRAIEQAAEKRGEERYKNQMATLSSAGSEPAGGAGAIHAGDGAQTVEEAIARAFTRPAAA